MPDAAAQPGLFFDNPELAPLAQAVSRRFGIAIIYCTPAAGYFLYLADEGLQLRQSGKAAHSPVMIDFTAGTLDHRRRFGGGRGQPLARAVGMKAGFSPRIFDATAGLGRDAFVFACCGCEVTLCERAPQLAALLDDALSRAAGNQDIGNWISQRMLLQFGDAAQVLESLDDRQLPQVIYMDPMYPQHSGSARVKKEMQALQQLLGADTDSEKLFRVAWSKASRRVVVKRPRRAGWLGGRKPSTSIESKNTRYDIYITLQNTG